MSDAPLMVGVSGLRGIVGKSLTPEVAARFGAAVGVWVQRHGPKARGIEAGKKRSRPVVAVGRDGRYGGNVIVNSAVAGLAASGCDVIACDVAMTPTMAVFVDASGASAGLVITASHNPQEWNGIKVLVPDAGAPERSPSACAPGKAAADQIVANFRSSEALYATDWKRIGEVEAVTEAELAHDLHGELLFDQLSSRQLPEAIKGAAFRVALDCVGGSGAILSPDFLEQLGCEVEVSGDYQEGVFTHVPEPTRENLTGLCDLVKKHKAAIGFAQDPDADRLAIVDERGEYIGEEFTLALAAEALLGEGTEGRRDGGTKAKKVERVVVTNLSTSRMIDDVAARHGARVIRTAVGEANVVEVMKREAAAGREVVVGGEGNGGVIWPRVTYVRDSLSAMGLVLGLMARRKKKLSEIVASMPRYAIEKRKVELARKEDARPAVEKISKAYRGHGIDLQDGVRVDFAQGPLAGKAWLHVRASNTEPIMRLIAEAPTAGEARGVLDEAERVIAG